MKRTFGFCLAFTVVAATSALAGETSLGIGAGYVDPSDVGGTGWFTANVRLKVAERVAVEPEIGFWKKSESALDLIDVSIKDINVGANVLYQLPASDNVTLSLGGGVGAHFLKGAVGVLGFEQSDSETKFGAQILAGLDFKVGETISLFTNLRYDLVSDFNQFKAYGGLRLAF